MKTELYVEVTAVSIGGEGESVLVNPHQVTSIWPARPTPDVTGSQAHSTLHCADGERIAIAETVAEFSARCQAVSRASGDELGVPPSSEKRGAMDATPASISGHATPAVGEVAP